MITAYGHHVAITRYEIPNISRSGLYLPTTWESYGKEKPNIGKVLSVGNKAGCLGLAAGQTVIFDKYAGEQVGEILILHSRHIMAIIED